MRENGFKESLARLLFCLVSFYQLIREIEMSRKLCPLDLGHQLPPRREGSNVGDGELWKFSRNLPK